MKKQIGATLKKWRKQHGWTIHDVVIQLHDQYGIDVADKTVYGWESDQSYPRSGTLLMLCELYQRENTANPLLRISPDHGFPITVEERDLIRQYRQHPELQDVVRRVLDVPEDDCD